MGTKIKNENNNLISEIMVKIRNRYFFILDLLIFLFTPFLAFVVRFDGFNYDVTLLQIFEYGLIFSCIKMIILYYLGIYSRWWTQASIDDLLSLLYGGIAMLFGQLIVLHLFRVLNFITLNKIPYSITILDAIFAILFISLVRFSFRMYSSRKRKKMLSNSTDTEGILIYGAGAAGVMALEEIRRNKNSKLNVKGFIDDDPLKAGMFIHGVKVIGNRNNLKEAVRSNNIKKILIAIPTASGKEMREIIEICRKIDNLEILTVPPLYDIIDGKVEINKLRRVDIEDLLRREPIKTDIEKISNLIEGKSILVTGAGGSIGKEICRQVLRFNPSQLIMLGHGENSIFEAEMELKRVFPASTIIPFITSVTDAIGIDKIFRKFNVDFIFHAAAHKHVPLMEYHPYEAIRNNIIGTKVLLEAAIENNVKKFIMISTDKAVNPISVMGTTKRIAEMMVINYAKKYNQKFSVVRFGNVLGSRGSVVKIFKSQIEQGGPVTVTHPDIKRYFMTIPESVQLVMQAFSMGNGGDIFIFDMGQPVRIVELAENLINLSGLKVGEDIDITITGLRPGEKLYEELFNGGEKFSNTLNDKIFIAENSSKIVPEHFDRKLSELIELASNPLTSDEEFKLLLKELVPEYQVKGNFQNIIIEK